MNKKFKNVIASVLVTTQLLNISSTVSLCGAGATVHNQKNIKLGQKPSIKSENIKSESKNESLVKKIALAPPKMLWWLIKNNLKAFGIFMLDGMLIGVAQDIASIVCPEKIEKLRNNLEAFLDNMFLNDTEANKKVEQLNLHMIYCCDCVGSAPNTEKKLKILDNFLNLNSKNFRYEDIEVTSLEDNSKKDKFSENIKKFYKRMALICHTDKLMQESEEVQKIGEEVFKKLDDWRKRMNNSKIDKK